MSRFGPSVSMGTQPRRNFLAEALTDFGAGVDALRLERKGDRERAEQRAALAAEREAERAYRAARDQVADDRWIADRDYRQSRDAASDARQARLDAEAAVDAALRRDQSGYRQTPVEEADPEMVNGQRRWGDVGTTGYQRDWLRAPEGQRFTQQQEDETQRNAFAEALRGIPGAEAYSDMIRRAPAAAASGLFSSGVSEALIQPGRENREDASFLRRLEAQERYRRDPAPPPANRELVRLEDGRWARVNDAGNFEIVQVEGEGGQPVKPTSRPVGGGLFGAPTAADSVVTDPAERIALLRRRAELARQGGQ